VPMARPIEHRALGYGRGVRSVLGAQLLFTLTYMKPSLSA